MQFKVFHDKQLVDFSSEVEWTVYIADEVEREIRSHFGNEKDKEARKARRRVAELIERNAIRVTLSEYQLYLSDPRLGADSTVDKRLITFAYKLAESGKFDIVLLATNDGGIEYDIASNPCRIVRSLSSNSLGLRQNEMGKIVCDRARALLEAKEQAEKQAQEAQEAEEKLRKEKELQLAAKSDQLVFLFAVLVVVSITIFLMASGLAELAVLFVVVVVVAVYQLYRWFN